MQNTVQVNDGYLNIYTGISYLLQNTGDQGIYRSSKHRRLGEIKAALVFVKTETSQPLLLPVNL